ncbi:transposase [Aneurinibacillus sp. Ricciae_BoGa-3]|uniref:RNA-guided endonuclease InsQ/TnpB family protein n=1 Tax=Aneurinibacillus sp. Ricciae_BoGa-3 TaxID=3022697 RepID=UPI0023401B65|nr:transposase [Aneurinibacillus sp. Ricciae_BoGa-3]WCK54312.1 transposase [Aneurinibacillus sp. Ricciae_BoGa-3]
MATVTHLVKIKKPTKAKHKEWIHAQQKYAACINLCIARILNGDSLSSSNVEAELNSSIKNEAIRKAKRAVADYKQGPAKKVPTFKSRVPISINNQNWDTKCVKGRWYVGFVVDKKKKYLPVEENAFVTRYFSFFQQNITYEMKQVKNKATKKLVKKEVRVDKNRENRSTIQLLRKGSDWYFAIPIEISCEIRTFSIVPQTFIGVDVGLRHLAVISEPKSGKRQYFSGKEVGYIRRHFRSLRRSLGKKKALRAIKRLGHKENRWMQDYNRKLAKKIVDFALQFDRPVIKMEKLYNIRQTCKTMKKADRTIHSWAFYQLQRFIIQRAEKCNVRVIFVNPKYTSQECPKCHHIEKANRNKDVFHCMKCGHRDHADHNASKNIALSTSIAV